MDGLHSTILPEGCAQAFGSHSQPSLKHFWISPEVADTNQKNFCGTESLSNIEYQVSVVHDQTQIALDSAQIHH